MLELLYGGVRVLYGCGVGSYRGWLPPWGGVGLLCSLPYGRYRGWVVFEGLVRVVWEVYGPCGGLWCRFRVI